MPGTMLALLVVVAVLVALVRLGAIRGPRGSTARVERWLGEQGWQVRHMERRWLTRGPFPDILPAGVKHSGLLYRVEVVDADGQARTGWIALPPGWQWQPTDRWRLQWDAEGATARRGLSTPAFWLLLLVAAAAVLLVVLAIVASQLSAVRS